MLCIRVDCGCPQRADYKEECSITKHQVLNILKKVFLNQLEHAINKVWNPEKAKSKDGIMKDDAMPTIGESAGLTEEAPRTARATAADAEVRDAISNDKGDDNDVTNVKQ
ncbi:hypothetical protein L873DRAFT_1849564 [Choiromyces venosus 120613-1]|uniref:Uncharacterized protein n=1 Tax=Choiromyces venosus 120613-1 TaxID=1336337 RepID=A0A3N4IX57_9PEZI|nr:hypothetical protein L873DRAFT_1849564 [Choiromyces venosus 120613-1]